MGATAYYNNTNNAKYVDASGNLGDNVPETFAIQLSTSPFVNAAAGNFYPVSTVKDASGNTIPNPIIDSSVDSLADRPNMVSVRNPIGLPLSPILAPVQDIYGQMRVDDPSVAPPLGMGWSAT